MSGAEQTAEFLHRVLDRLDAQELADDGKAYLIVTRAKSRLDGLVGAANKHRHQVGPDAARAEVGLPDGWRLDPPKLDKDLNVVRMRAAFDGRGFRVQVFSFNSPTVLASIADAVDCGLIEEWVEQGKAAGNELRGMAA